MLMSTKHIAAAVIFYNVMSGWTEQTDDRSLR